MVKLHFYALATKMASVLCYTVRIFECPSIYLDEHPRFRGYLGDILDIIMRYFEVYWPARESHRFLNTTMGACSISSQRIFKTANIDKYLNFAISMVKLAGCKSALNPPVVYSTDRFKAVVPVLVLFFLALWFILRGDLLYVFPCVILFLCFLVLLVLRLPRLVKRELILVLFVRFFDLCLFGFVGFLFLLGSGKGCGLWLWHSLDFSLTFFLHQVSITRMGVSSNHAVTDFFFFFFSPNSVRLFMVTFFRLVYNQYFSFL